MNGLERLAGHVASTQDAILARRGDAASARALLLGSLEPHPASRARRFYPWALAAALAVGVALFVLVLPRAHQAPPIAISTEPAPALPAADLRPAPDEVPAEEPSTVPTPSARAPEPPHPPPVSPRVPTREAPAPRSAAASREPDTHADTWTDLAARGRYAPAFESAQRRGLMTLCDEAPAGELLTLSEVARWSGHASDARRPLLSARARFAGSAEAAAATFALGRIAFDNLRDYGEAAQWFAALLQEQPNGVLAREASGRLLEAYERLGNQSRAAALAERYLARYPAGPHAGLASRILGR